MLLLFSFILSIFITIACVKRGTSKNFAIVNNGILELKREVQELREELQEIQQAEKQLYKFVYREIVEKKELTERL